MPSQRPFFLSSFIAAFRQQPSAIQQPAKPPANHSQSSTSPTTATTSSTSATSSSSNGTSAAAAVTTTPSNHRSANIPIRTTRRRGSDSSTEGFRDAVGAERWYIGGRTAGGEERFFKLGVMRRVRSNDGLSLDRLSL